ncbi:MAG: ion transporter [Pseudomonadota bacterium]
MDRDTDRGANRDARPPSAPHGAGHRAKDAAEGRAAALAKRKARRQRRLYGCARAALDGRHPRFGRAVPVLVTTLIITTAVSIALETVPDLPDWAPPILVVVEIGAVVIFALEYVLRLIVARRPLRYALSPMGIVDLLSFLPSIILLLPDYAAFRTLRLIRLVRLLKLAQGEDAAGRLGRAVAAVKDELIVVLFAGMIVLYLSAVGIYLFEHREQPEAFSSIPASMWWAIATLTTVGYGDVVPITTGGRIFTGIVMLIGIGVVAVPTGLIATALMALKKHGHNKH